MFTLLARLHAAVEAVDEMRDSLTRIETALGVNRPYEETVAAIERILRGEPHEAVWGRKAEPRAPPLPVFAVDQECATLATLLTALPPAQLAAFHNNAGGEGEDRARRLALLLRLATASQREHLARQCPGDILAALEHLSIAEIVSFEDVSALRKAVEAFRHAIRHDGVAAQAIAQTLAGCGGSGVAAALAQRLAARGAAGQAVQAEINRYRLDYADLPRLAPADLQVLLRTLDRTVLATALAAPPEAVRAALLGQLTSRAARMLVDDPPDAARDPAKVAAARRAIMDEVQRLIGAGEMSGPGGAPPEALL